MRMTAGRRQTGFTLIEVVIVVAILGIIAAFAYPAYTSYVDQSRRGDAQRSLMELASDLERCYSINNSYEDCLDPDSLESEDGFYDIGLEIEDDGQGFTLTANPKGVQENRDGDACEALVLDQSGRRDAEGEAVTDDYDECWDRPLSGD